MGSTVTNTKEVTLFLPNLLRLFNDGTIERLQDTPFVPPSLEDPTAGFSSKDVVISQNPSISARLYLPTTLLQQPHDGNNKKVPILVYFHGGGFFFESAFNQRHHEYINAFVSIAEEIMVVSVEYRLAPETPLPAGYNDCFDALKWVAAKNTDPWLINHGDFQRVFIGGDSAGANIVHNVALRAGAESLPNGVTLLGAFLSHPYFLGSEPIGSEPVTGHEETAPYVVWSLVYPSAPNGIDNPMINPLADGAPSLAGLGCSKILVCVASKDEIRDRGVWYYEGVKKSGWKGELELFEVEGEDHTFHIHNPESENSKKMLKKFAEFITH